MSRLKALLIVIVVAAGVFASVASGDSGDDSSGSGSNDTKASGIAGTKNAEGDVTIESCTPGTDGFSGPAAAVKITNNSSKTSNYLITVAFEAPDGNTQLDTGNAVVSNLASGQTANETAQSLKKEANVAGLTCKVASVTRYAS